MPKFDVDIPHTLAQEEARSRIAGATSKLERDYGATCTWEGNHQLVVSRKGLDSKFAQDFSREDLHDLELVAGLLATAPALLTTT